MLTAKEWLSEIKRRGVFRRSKSKYDTTINFGSNKTKAKRKETKKEISQLIRMYKRKYERKLSSDEIFHIKSMVKI